MDLNKIGSFITQRRKAQNLTQMDVARRLSVTDRAVSKWECGKGLPDVSLMIPLCEMLDITLNEFLQGETISSQEAAERAEKQIIDLLRERQQNKKKLWLSIVVGVVGISVLLVCILLAAYATIALWARILVVIFGAVVMVACFAVTILIDIEVGSYECPNCKKTFVPDLKTYTKSPQTFTKRKMLCPHCSTRGWCKKKLNK